MKNPTPKELQEYVDGTISSTRAKEITTLVASSEKLQLEVALLKAMNATIRKSLLVSPSRNFTEQVMEFLVPADQKSHSVQVFKSSANLFAMAVVLTIMALVVTLPSEHSSNSVMEIVQWKVISQYISNSFLHLSEATVKYFQPIQQTTENFRGKIIYVGLGIFFLFVFLDSVIVRRLPRFKMKL